MITPSPEKILIIEDNRICLKLLKRRLETHGYSILTAEDGLEGLNIAKKEKPDLIILDLMLPGMNGHQVCRFLKFNKIYQNIPIIILTSRDLEKDKILAQHSKCDAFFIKTTKASVFMDVIEDLLKKYESKKKWKECESLWEKDPLFKVMGYA